MDTPNIDDKVFFQYGAMCGNDRGVVIAKRETRWGVDWEVLLEDCHTDTIHGYIGTTDNLGTGADQIGVYLIKE
jgi:hypothetical protein